MESLLDAYRDPLFVLFPVGTTVAALLSLACFMIPYTAIALRDPASVRRYKVQPAISAEKRRETARDTARGVTPSAFATAMVKQYQAGATGTAGCAARARFLFGALVRKRKGVEAQQGLCRKGLSNHEMSE